MDMRNTAIFWLLEAVFFSSDPVGILDASAIGAE